MSSLNKLQGPQSSLWVLLVQGAGLICHGPRTWVMWGPLLLASATSVPFSTQCPLPRSLSLPAARGAAFSSTEPSGPALPASNTQMFCLPSPALPAFGPGLVSSCILVINGLVSAPPLHGRLLKASFERKPPKPPVHSTLHPGRAPCLLV